MPKQIPKMSATENNLAHIPLNGESLRMRANDGADDDDVAAGDDTVALKLEVNGGGVTIVAAKPKVAASAEGDADGAVLGGDGGVVEPPDGGTRAWLVMLSAFLCNSILFGIINTYGSVYLTLQEQMKLAGETDASSKAALVGSLTIGTTFLLSTVSGILTDQIGVRNTTLIGGLLAASGMFLSAIFVSNITALYFTYGVMFGLGAALAYTPSLSILGHYFKRYLGLANGFVTAGSSVSTAVLPFFLDYMIHSYSLEWTFCVLGIFTLFIIACSLIYKPLRPQIPAVRMSTAGGKSRRNKCAHLLRSLVNVENWKRPRYVIWAVSIPVALIGYFVPYVHTPKLVRDTFDGYNENTPIMCIGIASGVGRLVCGFLADRKGVNRIYLQQCSFIAIGLLTMLIPLTKSYTLLLVICSVMGLFDGCFISLLGPVAYEICGADGATQAIGFLLGMCSIPLTVGPPIAGMLYDHTNSYKLSFVLAGIPPLIGATMMCSMRFVDGRSADEAAEEKRAAVVAAAARAANGGEVGEEMQAQQLLNRPAWIDDNLSNIKITCNGNGHSAAANGHAQSQPVGNGDGGHHVAAIDGRKASLASTETLNDHVDRH